MCTYLHGPRGSIYYFRRAIPKDVQPYLQAGTEWMFSLRTKDRAEAKELVPLHTIRTGKLLKQARARLAAGEAPPTPAAPKREFTPQELEERDRVEWEHKLEAMAFSLEQDWQEEADRESNPEAFVVADAVAAARLRWEEDRREERREIARQRSASAVSINSLFDGYAKLPGLRAGTVCQFRAIVSHLIQFLDHDDASRVTPVDIVRWRNRLVEEPTKSGKPRSAKTINSSYLAAASVTFSWGVDSLLIPSNPVAGVAKVRADKTIQVRDKDFTHREREIILSAALRPQTGKLSSEHVLARRWVPWLCAYTGARVNEMTQLRAEDVREVEGVWTIHITPEAGNVKTDKARTVPLHEHLIEQGFPAVAMTKGTGPLFYDPGRERSGMERGQYKRTGMRLAEWVRALGISDLAIKPNHAWRHTFKTICLEAGIEERAADYMQGHASKGVGRTYGTNTLTALVRQLALFPRFQASMAVQPASVQGSVVAEPL